MLGACVAGHAGGVRRLGDAGPRADPGRCDQQRLHRGLLRRDGGGARRHGVADAAGEVRARVHVRVLDAGKTGAARRRNRDDVPEATKKRRLAEIIAAQRQEALRVNQDGSAVWCACWWMARRGRRAPARRADVREQARGHRPNVSQFARFDPKAKTGFGVDTVPLRVGEYVAARVTGANASTLFAEPVARTTLREFYRGR